MNDRQPKLRIPESANFIIHTLQAAGYEAYVVGGCVRDCLLEREPQDWDITTSAHPEQVKELFRKTIDTGLKHGTVTVLHKGEAFEVTTYRVDGDYEDGRHPKEVRFTPSLGEDLLRRDFTINAMAYNDEQGLVDLHGGLEDMEAGVIRCVGTARERFGEDALRMLRAIRFSAQLGYRITEDTRSAIRELAPTLKKVSSERIQVEVIKTICSDHPDIFRLAYETGLTAVFFPEFDRAMETDQNHPHHMYSVGEHILQSLGNIAPEKALRLTMLLHDIGKPRTLSVGEDGITHFYQHPEVSAQMAREILRRWKLDNQTIDTVCQLVRCHDYGNGQLPTPQMARRAVHKIGIDLFPLYLQVRYADTMAQSLYLRKEKLENIRIWQDEYERILNEKHCVSLKDLAITGRDLIAEGIEPGPHLGSILSGLLEEVLDDPARNEREYLMKRAKELA